MTPTNEAFEQARTAYEALNSPEVRRAADAAMCILGVDPALVVARENRERIVLTHTIRHTHGSHIYANKVIDASQIQGPAFDVYCPYRSKHKRMEFMLTGCEIIGNGVDVLIRAGGPRLSVTISHIYFDNRGREKTEAEKQANLKKWAVAFRRYPKGHIIGLDGNARRPHNPVAVRRTAERRRLKRKSK